AARPLGRRRSHADPWRNTGRIISSTDGAAKKSGPLPHLARARPFQGCTSSNQHRPSAWGHATRSRPARSIDILRETARSGVVRHTKTGRAMSALGQKRTLTHVHMMSALPPKADIAPRHSRFTAIASLDRANIG